MKPHPTLNVSNVGSIFETNEFYVAFASNFATSPDVSMHDFQNTEAFQDQERLNLSNFTNYDNDPADLNATLKSFSKNLLFASEKIGDSTDGAVFIS